MKWKLKALAAAVAVAVSAPASAAIALSGSGNGELFFSVWDSVTETSYTRDLGVTLTDFVTVNAPGGSLGTTAAGYTLGFAADSTLTSWLSSVSANAAGLIWNVAAMDGSGQNRYLTTAASQGGMANSQLVALNDSSDIYIANTNPLGTHASIAHGSNTASKAVDGDSAYAGGGNWGANWGNKAFGFTSGALIGTSNLFWALAANGTNNLTASFINQFGNVNGASTWTLASNGTLTFASPDAVSAVPVPAAAWLLGSGLIGLAGVARRRTTKLV